MKGRWLLALLPFAAGVLAPVLLNGQTAANPVLFLRASLSALLPLTGLALSILVAGLLLLAQGRQRRQAELQSRQRQAAEDRRRFLRRLDHELKNPLTAVRAGLANLTDAPLPESQRAAVTSVETQTVRLSRLTADLRKLAELEDRPLEKEPVDLNHLLQEVVELAQDRAAGQRRLTLSVPQAPWPLPIVSGDWDLLYLAAYNLVDNALKFTRPGDTIEVRAREDGQQVVIEVADTGPGIPAEELPHLWEELYRAEGARGVPGSGLGLALVKAIAERHGGQAVIASRAGQGTAVTVRLPTIEPAGR